MKKTRKLLLTLLTTAASVAFMSFSVQAAPVENEKEAYVQMNESKDEADQTVNEYLGKTSSLFKAKASEADTKENVEKVVGLTVLVDFEDEPHTISHNNIKAFLNTPSFYHYEGNDNNGSVREFFYDVSGVEFVGKPAVNYYFDKNSVCDKTKTGFVVVANNKVIDTNKYNTTYENQVNVGQEVEVEAALLGQIKNSFRYEYSVYYDGVEDTSQRDSSMPYAIGTLKFTPEEEGNYEIIFKVEDAIGNTCESEVYYIVR